MPSSVYSPQLSWLMPQSWLPPKLHKGSGQTYQRACLYGDRACLYGGAIRRRTSGQLWRSACPGYVLRGARIGSRGGAGSLEFLEYCVALDAGSDDDDTGRCEPHARQTNRAGRLGAPKLIDAQRLVADSANGRQTCVMSTGPKQTFCGGGVQERLGLGAGKEERE
eukprot:scaffold45576_cov67-Phaeocystis_antarctica.AAC.12